MGSKEEGHLAPPMAEQVATERFFSMWCLMRLPSQGGPLQSILRAKAALVVPLGLIIVLLTLLNTLRRVMAEAACLPTMCRLRQALRTF